MNTYTDDEMNTYTDDEINNLWRKCIIELLIKYDGILWYMVYFELRNKMLFIDDKSREQQIDNNIQWLISNDYIERTQEKYLYIDRDENEQMLGLSKIYLIESEKILKWRYPEEKIPTFIQSLLK